MANAAQVKFRFIQKEDEAGVQNLVCKRLYWEMGSQLSVSVCQRLGCVWSSVLAGLLAFLATNSCLLCVLTITGIQVVIFLAFMLVYGIYIMLNSRDFFHRTYDYWSCIPKKRELWVAVDTSTGKVLATVGLERVSGSTAELRRMVVCKEHCGQGLGGMAVQQAVTSARQLGYSCLVLYTTQVCHAAKRLYTKYGFVSSGTVPWIFNLNHLIEYTLYIQDEGYNTL